MKFENPDVEQLAETWGEPTPEVESRERRILRIEDLPPVPETLEPLSYLIEPVLPEGSIVGLTGDSGSGKSTVVTAWARDCIANSRPALILDRENPNGIVFKRMQHLKLANCPLLRWAGGWNGDVPGLESAEVLEWVQACNPKPLVVVDSLAAFLAGDENSAGDMRNFMNHARRLADLGATVVIVHHSGKADTSRVFRGSSDFKASVDQVFLVTNSSTDLKLDRLKLECCKSRYGFTGSVIYRYAGGKMLRDDQAAAPAPCAGDQLAALLFQNPRVTQSAFVELSAKAGLGRKQTRAFLKDGVVSGVIDKEQGRGGRSTTR